MRKIQARADKGLLSLLGLLLIAAWGQMLHQYGTLAQFQRGLLWRLPRTVTPRMAWGYCAKKEMTAHPQLEHAETLEVLPMQHIIVFRKKGLYFPGTSSN